MHTTFPPGLTSLPLCPIYCGKTAFPICFRIAGRNTKVSVEFALTVFRSEGAREFGGQNCGPAQNDRSQGIVMRRRCEFLYRIRPQLTIEC
jgi:hypothetical protein